MKVSQKSLKHDEAREHNLRLKLSKVLPQEEVDACENFAQLEAKKAILDAIEREARTSREMSEKEAIRYDLEASGEDIPVRV